MKRITLILILALICASAHAQFFDCNSGLMNAPSAEMEESGTFMITNNYLNSHNVPNKKRWYSATFAYGFDLTFHERVEITYVCTLVKGRKEKTNYWPEQTWGKFVNQDRHFSAKFLLMKEHQFWKWMPAIACGVCDPVTGGNMTDYIGSDVSSGNGFFNRMYAVATEHFDTPWGTVGGTLGYQYNLRKDCRYNAPCCAVTWDPVWLNRPDSFLSSFRLVAEYDARTFNLGLMTSVWKKHFEAMFELQDCRYITAGLRYRLVLK